MVAMMPEEGACRDKQDGVCDDEDDIGDPIAVKILGSVVDTPMIDIHHLAGWAVDDEKKLEGTAT